MGVEALVARGLLLKGHWLYPRDIAAFLGVSRPTATKILRSIPGAQMLYQYERRNGERWRVSVDAYRAWRRTVRGESLSKLDNRQSVG